MDRLARTPELLLQMEYCLQMRNAKNCKGMSKDTINDGCISSKKYPAFLQDLPNEVLCGRGIFKSSGGFPVMIYGCL